MTNNQAYELLTMTQKEAQEQSNRYWELVLACRSKYASDTEYAKNREQKHLEQAAYYEDRARSCQTALVDLAKMQEIREGASTLLQ